MAKFKFYKLGKHAHSWNDPITGMNIAGHEVIKVDINKISTRRKSLDEAIRTGHVVESDEAGYNSYLEGEKKIAKKAKALVIKEKTFKPDEEEEEAKDSEDGEETEEEGTEEEEEDFEYPDEDDMKEFLDDQKLTRVDKKKYEDADEEILKGLYRKYKDKEDA